MLRTHEAFGKYLMSTNLSEVPAPIQPVLQTYLALLHQTLDNQIKAVYLHGSIALDAFDPAHSDIDFLTVLNQSWTIADCDKLTAIHRQLIEEYPQWQLDGNYIPATDIGKPPAEIQPHPRLNGELNPQGTFDGGWVTWWILKYHGWHRFVRTRPANARY